MYFRNLKCSLNMSLRILLELLVWVQTCTAAMKISAVIPQEGRTQSMLIEASLRQRTQ